MAPIKLTERLWVIFTIGLISFIAFSSQLFVIWPWYEGELGWELVSLLAPFNALVGMIFWSYALCVSTEPGRVPDKWEPDPGREDMEVKRLTGGPRYCSKCSAYKPPRAHHCKVCNRCILRMDHHCPWVANCIGHHNYGSFIRFLTFVDLACTYDAAMVCWRVWDYAKGGENTYLHEPSGLEIIMIVLNLAACIPVLLCVSIFSLYHYWSLWSNTTTIESWEKDKVATLIRRGKIRDIKYPYNISPLRNIRSVLGHSPLKWCWPAQKVPGDGLRFAIVQGSDIYTSLSWPPQDPAYLPRHPRSHPSHSHALDPSAAFTYGHDAPNPYLQPSNSELRRRGGGARNPPWGPQGDDARPTRWSEDEESEIEEDGEGYGYEEGYGSEEEEEDEDDIPLGRRGVRIRRGSEGVEVRPTGWDGGGGAGGGGWEEREREEAVRRFEERRRVG